MLNKYTLRRKTVTLGLTLILSIAPGMAHAQYVIPAQASVVAAADFLPAEHMQSAYHTVSPQAYSNGYSNTYTITTPYHVYVVEGTDKALATITEIRATEVLRGRSTVGAVANSAINRTKNLVETPVRIAGVVGDEFGKVKSGEDALFFIPTQMGNVAGIFINGVGELGVTGYRIVKGVGGTRCSGVNCVKKAGRDIWSGLNSLTGKHDVSRRLHREFGTDKDTDNKAYQRQVDRISYADAYTGTTYKFGLGVSNANIDYFSPLVTGVGYANNVEFLAVYEDADRAQNRDKEALLQWGVSEQTLKAFYSNPNYTKIMRGQVVTALRPLGNPQEQARMFAGAATADTPYNARVYIAAYSYMAGLAQKGVLKTIVPGAPVAIAEARNGALIMPIVSDYLQLNPESRQPLHMLAALARVHPGQVRPEIHMIGTVTPEFTREAQRLGVSVKTVGTMGYGAVRREPAG